MTLYLRCHHGSCLGSNMLSGYFKLFSWSCKELSLRENQGSEVRIPSSQNIPCPSLHPSSHLTGGGEGDEHVDLMPCTFSGGCPRAPVHYALMTSVLLSSRLTWFFGFILYYKPCSQEACHNILGILSSLTPWGTENHLVPHCVPNSALF